VGEGKGKILTDPEVPVAMLDEKWFYKRNRRRRLKVLPLGGGEPEGADRVSRPKATSRRFPVKSMFLGVVGRPNEEHNFTGKILLERVSKTEDGGSNENVGEKRGKAHAALDVVVAADSEGAASSAATTGDASNQQLQAPAISEIVDMLDDDEDETDDLDDCFAFF
jgi:hypothetical protein